MAGDEDAVGVLRARPGHPGCWTSRTLVPPASAAVAKVWRRAWTRAPAGTWVRIPART